MLYSQTIDNLSFEEFKRIVSNHRWSFSYEMCDANVKNVLMTEVRLELFALSKDEKFIDYYNYCRVGVFKHGNNFYREETHANKSYNNPQNVHPFMQSTNPFTFSKGEYPREMFTDEPEAKVDNSSNKLNLKNFSLFPVKSSTSFLPDFLAGREKCMLGCMLVDLKRSRDKMAKLGNEKERPECLHVEDQITMIELEIDRLEFAATVKSSSEELARVVKALNETAAKFSKGK